MLLVFNTVLSMYEINDIYTSITDTSRQCNFWKKTDDKRFSKKVF